MGTGGVAERGAGVSFHQHPHGEISARVKDPAEFVNSLYRRLLDYRPYFPGNTNYIGACIDCVLEQLEAIGACRSFDEE